MLPIVNPVLVPSPKLLSVPSPKLRIVPAITPTNNVEILINQDGALVLVIRNWLPNSQQLHQRLIGLPWIFAEQNMYGRIIPVPRGMFFLGDANVKTYKYSRLSFPVQCWYNQDNDLYTEIEHIRTRIQNDPVLKQYTGTELKYNSCLINYYRDGRDKIDHHSDKEALGPANAVVTISTGASCTFEFKSKTKGANGRYPKITTTLNSGDLVLMTGRCQELWTHGIPREEERTNSRCSCTYRLN